MAASLGCFRRLRLFKLSSKTQKLHKSTNIYPEPIWGTAPFPRDSTDIEKYEEEMQRRAEIEVPFRGPPKKAYEYVVSYEDFKHVEKYLPKTVVPELPEHASYPTPSGFYPQSAESTKHPYFINRTKNHMLPIYQERSYSTMHFTKIKGIDGDIWKMEADLRKFLEDKLQKKMQIKVCEITRSLHIKGTEWELIAEFAKEKGF